ncbi:MAG: DUF1957 domain-containing protein [Actinobacteria bacterium]|nr:DUF1957 domain-containing protein [Actinomycetota bacterium]
MPVPVVLLLHTHMPYVRRNGDWPVGEEWILEAWAECYLPIWKLVEDLAAGKQPGRLALTLTPILWEQLDDPYLQDRLAGYLENKARQARNEVERMRGLGDDNRGDLARRFAEHYSRLLGAFEKRFRGRMAEVLREGTATGRVEVLASAATHALLPALSSEPQRRAQVAIGLESYRRVLGRDPEGFWLPECAYTPGLDELLSSFAPPLSYVVLDHTAVPEEGGIRPTWEPRLLGDTSLIALARDPLAHDLVWTERGYPAGGNYREYAKRDYDGYGFQYWRVTSPATPLDEKDVYRPENAVAQASEDASHFVENMRRRGEEIASSCRSRRGPTLILAAYDTELMGHWWLEGTLWLRHVLALLEDDAVLPGHIAGEARASKPRRLHVGMTAWNVDGTFSTWVNRETSELLEYVHLSEMEFGDALACMTCEALGEPPRERALLQAARELLILQASDWPFMVTRDQAAAYARDRASSHRARFNLLLEMALTGRMDEEKLAFLENTDNPFSWLTLDPWL